MNSHLKGMIFVLSAAVMWGIGGIAAQYLFYHVGVTPEWLVTVRLIASGVLLLAFAYSRTKTIFPVLRQNFFAILLLGVIGLLCSQYLFYVCIAHSNAPTATILVFLLPVFLMLYTLIFKRRRPSGLELLSVVLAVIGTLLIVTKGDFTGIMLSPAALASGITASLCCVVYTIQPRRMLAQYPPANVIGWGMLAGGIAMAASHDLGSVPPQFDAFAFLAVLAVVFLGTTLAFLIYLKSILLISPTEVGVLTVGEPLSSIVLSSVLLGVSLSVPELIGAALIISTVFILAKAKS